MSKEHRGLTAPLGDRPSEPFFIKGPMANHLMNMILDEPQCQSCRRHITSTEGWGVVADVRRDNPNEDAYIQAVRLCSRCWAFPADAMRQLTRGWL